MNILFILISPGDEYEETYAVIPSEAVEYDLSAMNGHILGRTDEEIQDYVIEQIRALYERLGMEISGRETDLKKYLRVDPPFVVDKVIIVGWVV